jgi:hypothetical protein
MEQLPSRVLRQFAKISANAGWVPAYLWQRAFCKRSRKRPIHLIIAVADHFEPYIVPHAPKKDLPQSQQLKRVRDWCNRYPAAFSTACDSNGSPFRHTYFFPAERADVEILEILADHCRAGFGEIEIHLHHGVSSPDTAENTRTRLVQFRDLLAALGCLSRTTDSNQPRYAFVHGNWALANSAKGRFCGVDSEMQILAETGCYADFTLPSAPARGQVSKVNSIYECKGALDHVAPHRQGRDLRRGFPPSVFPIIVQGPLLIDWGSSKSGIVPVLENSALTAINPPTMRRCRLWMQASVSVKDKPDWVFVKLHCHGMDPRDTDALLGRPMLAFLRELITLDTSGELVTHFVTAREMVNIILAACEGKEGSPSLYRNSTFRSQYS